MTEILYYFYNRVPDIYIYALQVSVKRIIIHMNQTFLVSLLIRIFTLAASIHDTAKCPLNVTHLIREDAHYTSTVYVVFEFAIITMSI